MSEPTQTIEGWYALHDFRTIDWHAWKAASEEIRADALRELTAYTEKYRADDQNRTGGFGVYTIAGHKADLLFVHFRSTVSDLMDSETEFDKTSFATFTKKPYSYLSIVELSSYLSKPDIAPEDDPQLLPRLRPQLSEMMPHICFYPMNKRRSGNDNWFMLSMEERVQLMRSHGMIGRKYAGRVTQIITGSAGLDDWEWGVTLYANDPLEFKKLVYEMRFDEVSARYGEFGVFYVGHVVNDQELVDFLQL
ncbi:hydrogen peroxide-dependent heme synthase [Sulfoacidibacillus ferrooxidans]|uniref:Coproheme decarboxylase n=1 Tax=Sulfoacidibacillus ferrooxidans TaxID=2005001 RepID=A0A9X1V7U0_9BACL|nr:hydrogen peroxide-dependent heme synthase [Sulfoacidibacillus ferrooxidans]MCI0182777.1 putative heme-dependent peroxidase [Sulfoacidibacillus ferrooxidans]